jgi:hypothetical protein
LGKVIVTSKKAEIRPAPLLPARARHSEQAGIAVLRAGQSPGNPRLAVVYPGREVSTELTLGRDVLWSGPWQGEFRRDGQPIETQAAWEETCWYTDADVDYLELQLRCGGGVRIERHLLLARQDRLLLLADVLLTRRQARLDYRGSLPLADGVTFHGAKPTCEGVLKGHRSQARVLPLALPEWREAGDGGSLCEVDHKLELRLASEGTCLFAPLLFDLAPRRLTMPLTWRHLTVGENLTAVPRDVAVGYRVLIGGKQWLIYRAMASKGNRTLLGHNLSGEFLLAQFLRGGHVESLLEIE